MLCKAWLYLTLGTALGYNDCIIRRIIGGDLEKGNEEVILQFLASVYDYKEEDFDSRHCKLYRSVLRIN
jgi:hypothetical protein